MAQVPLLEAFGDRTAKARHVGPGELEEGEGLDGVVIVEIVIGVERLFFVDPVVEPQSGLISAHPSNHCALKRAIRAIREGHKLLQI